MLTTSTTFQATNKGCVPIHTQYWSRRTARPGGSSCLYWDSGKIWAARQSSKKRTRKKTQTGHRNWTRTLGSQPAAGQQGNNFFKNVRGAYYLRINSRVPHEAAFLSECIIMWQHLSLIGWRRDLISAAIHGLPNINPVCERKFIFHLYINLIFIYVLLLSLILTMYLMRCSLYIYTQRGLDWL